jgi:hypothetical protein
MSTAQPKTAAPKMLRVWHARNQATRKQATPEREYYTLIRPSDVMEIDAFGELRPELGLQSRFKRLRSN